MKRAEMFVALAKCQNFYGMKPLGHLDSDHAVDRCASYIGQASALLDVIASAFRGAGDLSTKEGGSALDNLNPELIAGALEGVQSLIDMAGIVSGGDA